MKTCVIESPYAGVGATKEQRAATLKRNKIYLERCILWCATNGFAPYASHKMMTDALDDNQPDGRALGIACGMAFRRVVGERIFFLDYDWSGGMLQAAQLYDNEGLSYREQLIGVNP